MLADAGVCRLVQQESSLPLWLSSERCYILHYRFSPGVDRSQVRVSSRMLTYAHVCSRTLTYADVCYVLHDKFSPGVDGSQVQHVLSRVMHADADGC